MLILKVHLRQVGVLQVVVLLEVVLLEVVLLEEVLLVVLLVEEPLVVDLQEMTPVSFPMMVLVTMEIIQTLINMMFATQEQTLPTVMVSGAALLRKSVNLLEGTTVKLV